MSSALIDLAKRLETDIRRRCLTPGHKYLTAEESAKMLGTSVATANRALRLLAEQEVVVRRRNSGTFVGPAIQGVAVDEVQTVSILAPARMKLDGSVRFDLIIQGVLANLPDVVDVRVSYVPAENALAFVRNIIEPERDSGRLAGVVAISCSRDVYRYLGENDFPMVVMGSLYPDQPYPSIDADERAAGQMLTSYLIERGHRRLAMFSDSEFCPGDNYFRDGVSDALTSSNFPHNALLWRTPGPDPTVLRAQVEEVLAMPERPTGVVVKLPKWADEIAAIVEERGLSVPKDVEIVFKGFAVGEAGKSAFPHVRPNVSYRTIAEIAGKMLAIVRQQAPLDERTVVIPYEMRRSPDLGVVD
jgi:hypothetical protein